MLAAIFPLGILGEMTSIGTLVAFFLVHLSVIIVGLYQESIYIFYIRLFRCVLHTRKYHVVFEFL